MAHRRRLSRRDFLRMSALAATGTALAGCVPATPTRAPQEAAETKAPTKPPTAPPPEKATIEFWFEPPGGGEAAACIIETVVDPFNEQSDTISVNSVAQPELWQSTRTALAGGAGPDIVGTPGPSFVYEMAQANQLLALGELADEFGWQDLFLSWALSLGEVEGKLYSVADELETLVLYYNKTIFEKYNWEPPETIEEMMALCETIASEDIIPFAHANADWRAANEWFVGEFLNHVAGPRKVYEALKGESPWTDPDFVRAIELLNEMQQKGWFMDGLEFYYTTSTEDRQMAFASGEAAMDIEGTWAMDNWPNYFTEETGGNEWDWVPVPSTSGEAIFDIGMGHTWSINKNTENPRAAGEFLTYFNSPEVQGRRFRNCGLAPAPIKKQEQALKGADPRVSGIFKAFSEASEAGNYGYTTWTFWPPKSDAYIYEEVEKVWAGDMTAEEYLQGLQDLFAEELDAGAIPPMPTRE